LRLRPALIDGLRPLFGGKVTPGVGGFLVGRRLMVLPVPPGRRLLTTWTSPTVLGRIVPRPDGGCDLRLSVYAQGFPWRTIKDPAAMAVFDEWLTRVASELGAQ
jgi:hypothetical protein